MPAKTFSLILATCGRIREVDRFLQSVAEQDCDLSAVEVLIVDQNGEQGPDIGPVVDKYRQAFDIQHIRSGRRGLSLSRNLGIRAAGGQYLAFPDDDCVYYPDTLREAANLLDSASDTDLVLGRIVDRATRRKIIRQWPDTAFPVTLTNFFLNYAAITIFCRRSALLFDESLGLGTDFGSYEDADYIIQALRAGQQIRYDPRVEVWHPEARDNFPEAKLYSYGRGFGALCRKYRSVFFLGLFFRVLGYHFLRLLLSVATLDRRQSRRSFLALVSRIRGFRDYKA